MYFALGLGSLLTFKEVEVTLNVALSWEISRRQEPQIVKIETIIKRLNKNISKVGRNLPPKGGRRGKGRKNNSLLLTITVSCNSE